MRQNAQEHFEVFGCTFSKLSIRFRRRGATALTFGRSRKSHNHSSSSGSGVSRQDADSSDWTRKCSGRSNFQGVVDHENDESRRRFRDEWRDCLGRDVPLSKTRSPARQNQGDAVLAPAPHLIPNLRSFIRDDSSGDQSVRRGRESCEEGDEGGSRTVGAGRRECGIRHCERRSARSRRRCELVAHPSESLL